MDVLELNRKYGPWIGLGSGALTVAFFRKGVVFAPAAAGVAVLGWLGGIALARYLRETDGEGRRRQIARAVATAGVASLYQHVLFFLIPIWFGSATWTSINIAYPILIAAMAIFSCFEEPYRHLVLDRPWTRTFFGAAVLFAALVPAITLITGAPVGRGVAGAAGLASIAAGIALVPPADLKRVHVSLLILAGAVVAGGLAYLGAPLLPPVPVQRAGSAICASIAAKEPVGEDDEFPAGTDRVYAWFSVAAPDRYRQDVTFQWYREGEAYGRPHHTSVTGGRKAGFRTWAYVSKPQPGDWRVDVSTETGQLIGRETFEIE